MCQGEGALLVPIIIRILHHGKLWRKIEWGSTLGSVMLVAVWFIDCCRAPKHVPATCKRILSRIRQSVPHQLMY
jgi:hypothetical protein